MPTSSSTKRVFRLLSCVSIAGAAVTFANGAHADCPDPAPTSIPAYKPAHVVPGACTAADMAFYADAYYDFDTYPTYESLQTALAAQSATCAACVFTKEGDAEWGSIVLDEDSPDGDGRDNLSAYFEKAAGGSKTCAETTYKYDFCAGTSCAACTDDEVDQCWEDVDDDAYCGGYDYMTDCPNLATLLDETDDPVKVLTVLCGGTAPSPDAGTSSSGGSSGNSSSGSSGSTDDDDTSSSSSSSSSGSSGGKKKGSSSSGSEATPSDSEADDAGGCAQGRGSAGGSIASALVLAAAVGAAASRRRRKP